MDFNTPTADMMPISYGGERDSLKILDHERKLEEVPIDSEKFVNLQTEKAYVSKLILNVNLIEHKVTIMI